MEEKTMYTPIMAKLRKLEKGKTASFSLDRVMSVRASCNVLSLQSGLRFKTKTDREARTITVEKL